MESNKAKFKKIQQIQQIHTYSVSILQSIFNSKI